MLCANRAYAEHGTKRTEFMCYVCLMHLVQFGFVPFPSSCKYSGKWFGCGWYEMLVEPVQLTIYYIQPPFCRNVHMMRYDKK